MADPVVTAPPPAAAAAGEVKPAPVVAPAPAAAAPAAAAPPVADTKPTLMGDVKPPADAAAPKVEAVKVDYSKLKLPDGSKLQAADVDAFRSSAEKRGLSAEAAQAELAERSGLVQGYHDSLLGQHKASVDANRKAIEAHPKFGGANLKATNEAVTQVMERFAPKGLMERIQAAGYHWDPGFLEMLHNIHDATKDDKFVAGKGVVQPPQTGGLESMYKTK